MDCFGLQAIRFLDHIYYTRETEISTDSMILGQSDGENRPQATHLDINDPTAKRDTVKADSS